MKIILILGLLLGTQATLLLHGQEADSNVFQRFIPIIKENELHLNFGLDGIKSCLFYADNHTASSVSTSIIIEYRPTTFLLFQLASMEMFYFPNIRDIFVRSFLSHNISISQVWMERKDIMLYTSVAHKISARTNYADEVVKNINQTDVSVYFAYSLPNEASTIYTNGFRVFAKGGIGYYYDSKKLYPNLELGFSLGYAIKASIDVGSFLTNYDKHQLGSALLFKN